MQIHEFMQFVVRELFQIEMIGLGIAVFLFIVVQVKRLLKFGEGDPYLSGRIALTDREHYNERHEVQPK